MSLHRIGVLFSSTPDRRLLSRFLEKEGYTCWAPGHDEELASGLSEEIEQLSLILVEESVASRVGESLLAERVRCQHYLPFLVALEARSPSAPWLRHGFDDVLRLPLPPDELRARLKILLRHQERSVANLKRANTVLRQKNRELDQSRQDADRANRAKTEFLANISHELRTPLHGILGSVEILKEHPGCAVQRDQIEVSGRSLLMLVDDLLDFASLDSGMMRIHPRPVELAKQLEAVLAPLRSKAADKKLQFLVELDPDLPPWTETDPVRLSQVVSNLVGNAIKFTQQGRVKLSLRPEVREGTTELRIAVQDTGVGIPAGQSEQIFEPFHQADSSTTRSFEGTGLGLAIVARIVKAMEGSIEVSSPAGQGARFEVTLPLKACEPPAAVKPEMPKEERSLNILVVEDNPINSAVMKRLLAIWGHSAQVAYSGQQGLEKLEQAAYDLVLMDLQMPEMSGLEAARRIRKKEHLSGGDQIPIIALTARTREGDRDLCLRSGMNEYLTKPPDHHQLRELIVKLTSTS